jgi:hypothetical protein
MIFGRPPLDYAFTVVLWLLAIGYTAIAFGFPESARELPLLVGIALVVLSTIDLVSMTETDIGVALRKLNPSGAPADQTVPEFSVYRQRLAWGLVIGLVVALLLIGSLAATALYVAGSVYLLGRRPLLMSLAMGLIVAGSCYLLFDLALQVSLYPGLLFS